ncbi:MAG: hypothetical protein ACYTG6_04840 [Planctomycetota bacterium]
MSAVASGAADVPLKRRLMATAFALSFLASAPGCTRVTYVREPCIAPKHEPLQPHRTDYGRVLATLGPPPRMTATPTGFAFLYEHVGITEKQLGVSFETIGEGLGLVKETAGFSLGSVVQLSYSWGDVDLEALVLEFDHAGVLRAAAYDSLDEDLGTTLGVGLSFTITRQLGVEAYQYDAEQILWGRSLLDDLATQLNRPQGLDTGQSGLQRLPAGMTSGNDMTVPMPDSGTRQQRRRD